MFQASQKSKSLEAALFSLSSLYLETNESRMYRQSALGFLREELKHRDSCPIRECLGTILLLLQFTVGPRFIALHLLMQARYYRRSVPQNGMHMLLHLGLFCITQYLFLVRLDIA